jgi:hypothetical protein
MIDERDLREMLERRAQTISATPTDTPRATRRAWRRLALNAVVGALLGLVVVAGAIAGVRTMQAAPTPAVPGPPDPHIPRAEPETATLPAFDPALDDRYVITMELLDGYRKVAPSGVVFGSDSGQGISAWTVGNVYTKPCHWHDALVYPPVDSSVDGLVAALAAQKGHHATTPTDVELDGYAGKYMEMTVPAGMDVATCDRGAGDPEYRTWVDALYEGQRNLEAGQRDLLWIIDVDGTRLVIDAALGPETTKQDRADRIHMVESIHIDPV